MTVFDPYAPLNQPKPFGEGLWIVDGPEIGMDFPCGIKVCFPTRMCIVRLPDGRLWLHSPVAPDPVLVEQVKTLGDVAFLVAPNSIHYWFMPDWQALFPEARCHFAPGITERAEGRRAMPAGHLLTDHAPDDWSGVLDQSLVPGTAVSEAVFFHRATRTLILTDLIENFELARTRSPVMRMLLRLAGNVDPDGKAPRDLQATFRHHRTALAERIERAIGWAPERIVMAHGRIYEADGVAHLRRAFRWVLPQSAVAHD